MNLQELQRAALTAATAKIRDEAGIESLTSELHDTRKALGAAKSASTLQQITHLESRIVEIESGIAGLNTKADEAAVRWEASHADSMHNLALAQAAAQAPIDAQNEVDAARSRIAQLERSTHAAVQEPTFADEIVSAVLDGVSIDVTPPGKTDDLGRPIGRVGYLGRALTSGAAGDATVIVNLLEKIDLLVDGGHAAILKALAALGGGVRFDESVAFEIDNRVDANTHVTIGAKSAPASPSPAGLGLNIG